MTSRPVNQRNAHFVVLVATYNRLALLKTVVEAIVSGTRTPHELIVIDGGSTDGTIEYIQSHPLITPVLQGSLVGTARCYNRVWRDVDSTFTCWLSDDTEIVPGALDTAIGILEDDPAIGMVGLKMKDTKGPGRHEPYRGGISEFGILNCNHGVFRTALGREVGFFNESYRAYMVDPDMTASVLSTGHRVVMTREITVLHHREWAEKEGNEKVVREMGGIDNFAVYRQKFGYLAASATIATRLRARFVHYLWRLLFLGAAPGATRAGMNWRDWHNLAGGRFIPLLDPIATRGRAYHLVQTIPPALLAASDNPYRARTGAAAAA
jgi:GT2 family glycosyltransferase